MDTALPQPGPAVALRPIWPPVVATAALALPALVIAARGISGALTTRLPTGELLAAAAIAVLIAGWGSRPLAGRPWALAPQGALALTLASLSLAAGWNWLLPLIWLVAAAQARWSLRETWPLGQGADEPIRVGQAPPREPALADLGDGAEGVDDDLITSQQHQRQSTGVETVTGRLRVDFRPGQRTARGHVAFCPPLPGLPEIEWEQADGPEARVQLGQRLPHGARFDVKLADEPGEDVSVWIEFVAQCEAELT